MNKILRDLIKDGATEIQCGVYLETRERMMEDQRALPDEDESKDTDFTTSPLWITTDDGVDPIGIDSLEDIKEAIDESSYEEHKEELKEIFDAAELVTSRKAVTIWG